MRSRETGLQENYGSEIKHPSIETLVTLTTVLCQNCRNIAFTLQKTVMETQPKIVVALCAVTDELLLSFTAKTAQFFNYFNTGWFGNKGGWISQVPGLFCQYLVYHFAPVCPVLKRQTTRKQCFVPPQGLRHKEKLYPKTLLVLLPPYRFWRCCTTTTRQTFGCCKSLHYTHRLPFKVANSKINFNSGV